MSLYVRMRKNGSEIEAAHFTAFKIDYDLIYS